MSEKANPKRARELADDLEAKRTWASLRTLARLAARELRALADEVDRLEKERDEAELNMNGALEQLMQLSAREEDKWLPLLEAAEEAQKVLAANSCEHALQSLWSGVLNARIRAARKAVKDEALKRHDAAMKGK